ncbi:MAG TPA: hypothetical protein VMG82_17680 [Candidatus Sulfotelmatobacter sp.]|nr:hypothetical protein [Candidatus Sulfotelmatobacter sp.]
MIVETEESVVVRARHDQRSASKWCPVCRREVDERHFRDTGHLKAGSEPKET